MKNILCVAALSSILSIAACDMAGAGNGASADEQSARSFDPMAAYAHVTKLASAYTSNVSAVSLSATRQAGASATASVCSSFTWIWTVVGQDGTFVDVELSPNGSKVLAHEQRRLSSGQTTFEPRNVAVAAADAIAIAGQQKLGPPSDLYLDASVAANGSTAARWSVGFPKNELTLDGETGDLIKEPVQMLARAGR